MTNNDRWIGIHKLTEELGELVAILSCLQAYPEGQHPSPKYPEHLIKYVQEEMGDVMGALLWFLDNNNLSTKPVTVRAAEKMKLYDEWRKNGDGMHGI